MVIIVTVAAALMTFDAVKQYGVSLIASAGAAGIVVGLAARPVLTNLIAGIQLAITQPIRIGDAVIVENEWGWVEEITGTYVVIKVWDWRRLVVPLSYFLEKPFQNWTLPGHRPDRIGLPVGRLHGAGRPRPVQARGDRADDQAVERRGGQPAGRREQRTGRAVAGPGQRPHLGAGLGPALRGAREADRLPAADLSHGLAQAAAELVEFERPRSAA